MCRAAAADGVEAVIATPHLRREPWVGLEHDEVVRLVAQLERELAGDGPRVVPGGEIAVDSELLDDLLTGPSADLVSLAGSRYVLLEFDLWAPWSDPAELVHELRIAGWRPVVGHPERIPWLAEDSGLLAEIVAAGGLLQLTAMSVTGGFGRRAQNCCGFLIDHGLAHFVASDGHNLDTRPPVLSPARQVVGKVWGDEAAERLTRLNPAAVLADQPLEVEKEVRVS